MYLTFFGTFFEFMFFSSNAVWESLEFVLAFSKEWPKQTRFWFFIRSQSEMSVPAALLHSLHLTKYWFSHREEGFLSPMRQRFPIMFFVPCRWLAVQLVAQNSLSVSLWPVLEHCSLCGYCLQIILKSDSMSLRFQTHELVA